MAEKNGDSENECAEDFFTQEFPVSEHKKPTPQTQEIIEQALFSSEDVPPTSILSNSTAQSTNIKKPATKATFGVKKFGVKKIGVQKAKTDVVLETKKQSNEFDKDLENMSKLSLSNVEKDKNSSDTAPTEISSKFTIKQPITNEKKIQEKIKEVANDSNKTKIVDRLGMCGMGRGGVSHSLSSGIRTIQQEGVSAVKIASLKSFKEDFADDWEVIREEE